MGILVYEDWSFELLDAAPCILQQNLAAIAGSLEQVAHDYGIRATALQSPKILPPLMGSAVSHSVSNCAANVAQVALSSSPALPRMLSGWKRVT